jgi:murein DD-endopeptidase MepM/ murein hydrolase activator NlpD
MVTFPEGTIFPQSLPEFATTTDTGNTILFIEEGSALGLTDPDLFYIRKQNADGTDTICPDYFIKRVIVTDPATGENTTQIQFVQYRQWLEKIDLFYTITQKMSFDTAIDTILQELDYYADRREYYEFLAGLTANNDGETINLYGGHQAIRSPVKADLVELLSSGRIFSYNDYNFREWNKPPVFGDNMHYGIDISCSVNEPIYASTNGIIQNVNGNTFQIFTDPFPLGYPWTLNVYSDILPGIDIEYDKGVRPPLKGYVFYGNVKLADDLTNGSEVRKGQEIGTITTDRYCSEIGANQYLHFYVNCTAEYSKVSSESDLTMEIDPILIINY